MQWLISIPFGMAFCAFGLFLSGYIRAYMDCRTEARRVKSRARFYCADGNFQHAKYQLSEDKSNSSYS